ncbi:MAG: FAD-binding protein [Desulfobacterales bacterium]|nr:MAG: FAD-binding protein [Desulfobacterales bacterium]
MTLQVDQVYTTDVLVVGGGAAASMAAISATNEGADVLVLDKGQLGKSGCSPNAHGGMALYPKHENDSWKIHFEDTLMSGGFLNNQQVVRVLCQKGFRFVSLLEQFGSLFDRDADGTYSVRQFGGHRYKRSVFSGDETGHEMMNGLRREIARLGVKTRDEVMVLRLLTTDGEICGALALDIAKGAFIEVRAKAVVLATADGSGIWPAAAERQRGDGYCMALEAGAELADMEFIQYHPTHAWWPYGVRGSVSESFRAEGGYLLNSEGERFMLHYDPEQKELATRDKVSVCIYREILAGRGARHGGIYASVTHLPPDHIEKRLRVIFRKYMSYGFDIRKQPIEIRPRPHYLCGGVVANDRAETRVPGLYAAGAVTAGVHGANRLGSNALVDILVFGDIAGRNAAHRAGNVDHKRMNAKTQVEKEIKRVADLVAKSAIEPVWTPILRRRHFEMMDRYVGVLRTDEGLRHMLAEIERTQKEDLPNLSIRDKSRRYNFELRDALEMQLRLMVEEMSTRAAVTRTESRGSHFRDDYPKRDDRQWLKNIVFFKKDDQLVCECRAVEMSVMDISELPAYAALDSPWH